MKRLAVLLSLVCVAVVPVLAIPSCGMASATSASSKPLKTDRGRVIVDRSLGYPRLLTDRGTPLRAVALAWDGDKHQVTPAEVLSQDDVDKVSKVYGMNAIHLYLEKYNTNPDGSLNAGTNAAACDLLADRCSKAGLYLIITIGNGNEPNLNCYFPSMDFDRSFWRFYAGRYRDRTHVIYEVQNEPGAEVTNIKEIMASPDLKKAPRTLPWNNKPSPGDWGVEQYANEVELYKIIRSRAPENHVMMFSWCDFDNASKAREAVDYASAHGVDWSKTSVAFHGYVEAGFLEPTIQQFLYAPGNPAALTCTEVPQGDGTPDQVRLFERNTVGWCLFTWAGNPGGCLDSMKADFDKKLAEWKPDFGTWPDTMGVPVGSIIDLRSADGRYLLADSDGEKLMSPAANPTDAAASRFLVVGMGEEGKDGVALKSIATQRFVCADFNILPQDKPAAEKTAPLIASRGSASTWETFHWTWLDRAGNKFALKSAANGKYVTIQAPGDFGPSLWATAPEAGPDTALVGEPVTPTAPITREAATLP